MRFLRYLMLFIFSLGFLGTPCFAQEGNPSYVVEEQGRGTLRSLFDRKKKTPASQWEYARITQDRGKLKKAERRMLYLVRRWPNSKEAPWAARAYADILNARGKPKEAFKAYQFLIENYSSRMSDYESVLENQFNIALGVMEHRRLRWILGGYRTPEYAVDYFETVIRNGPQWMRAAEAQFLIGKCHQQAKELELAIAAYAVLGYRYPDSSFAEEAAWQQIDCLNRLRRNYTNSAELLDQTLTATTVFLGTYPNSTRKGEIIRLRNILYEVKAGKAIQEADFYANIPKEAEAALIYYERMIEEYPKSQYVPVAQERIRELRKKMALPEQSKTSSVPRSRPLFQEREDNSNADD